MGCDKRFSEREFNHFVSIHAPTWGATNTTNVLFDRIMFQSTHPHGVRHLAKSLTSLDCCFNPRTHMGCDSNIVGRSRLQRSFNPRTHMGCDVKNRRHQNAMLVSIHAPTWGATGVWVTMLCYMWVSIHAPTWGATAFYCLSRFAY